MRRSSLVTVALAAFGIALSASASAWPGGRPDPDRWSRPRWEPGPAVPLETGVRPARTNPQVEIDWDALEDAVMVEMNLFRKNPRAYADKLVELRSRMRGNLIERPGLAAIITQEGVAAIDEAIGALRRGPRRLPRFASTVGLAYAAADHARDLNATDSLGHDGSDGSDPGVRVSRYGTWDVMVSENIAFGPTTAEEIVVGLLVDDGVADRGHRHVLFERELFFAGVGCGPHPTYGATCVIDYAAAFESRPTAPAEDEDEVGPADDEGQRDLEEGEDDDVPACQRHEVVKEPDYTPPSRWRIINGPR